MHDFCCMHLEPLLEPFQRDPIASLDRTSPKPFALVIVPDCSSDISFFGPAAHRTQMISGKQNTPVITEMNLFCHQQVGSYCRTARLFCETRTNMDAHQSLCIRFYESSQIIIIQFYLIWVIIYFSISGTSHERIFLLS